MKDSQVKVSCQIRFDIALCMPPMDRMPTYAPPAINTTAPRTTSPTVRFCIDLIPSNKTFQKRNMLLLARYQAAYAKLMQIISVY